MYICIFISIYLIDSSHIRVGWAEVKAQIRQWGDGLDIGMGGGPQYRVAIIEIDKKKKQKNMRNEKKKKLKKEKYKTDEKMTKMIMIIDYVIFN